MAEGTAAGRAQGRGDAARFVLDRRALDRLLEGPEGPVAADLARRAVQVERRAKQQCPVDTGRLRASIAWRLATDNVGLAALIGTNVGYAPHVEFGTASQAPQPFLRPALAAAGGRTL